MHIQIIGYFTVGLFKQFKPRYSDVVPDLFAQSFTLFKYTFEVLSFCLKCEEMITVQVLLYYMHLTATIS